MLETLSQWHDTSLAVLGSLHDNIGLYKTQCEEARNAQSALTKKVDEVKATLRAQQDAGDAMRDDFEGGMDYDDDKMRKCAALTSPTPTTPPRERSTEVDARGFVVPQAREAARGSWPLGPTAERVASCRWAT